MISNLLDFEFCLPYGYGNKYRTEENKNEMASIEIILTRNSLEQYCFLLFNLYYIIIS